MDQSDCHWLAMQISSLELVPKVRKLDSFLFQSPKIIKAVRYLDASTQKIIFIGSALSYHVHILLSNNLLCNFSDQHFRLLWICEKGSWVVWTVANKSSEILGRKSVGNFNRWSKTYGKYLDEHKVLIKKLAVRLFEFKFRWRPFVQYEPKMVQPKTRHHPNIPFQDSRAVFWSFHQAQSNFDEANRIKGKWKDFRHFSACHGFSHERPLWWV